MVETRLVKPAKRLVRAWCPNCRHVRHIYDNSSRGVAHCMYCGADFEWQDNDSLAQENRSIEAGWFTMLGTATLPR